MATGHALVWNSALMQLGATVRSDVTNVAGADVGVVFKNSNVIVSGSNEAVIFQFQHTPNAVNYFYAQNNIAGGGVSIRALGADASINFLITAKGPAGGVSLRDGNGLTRVGISTTGVAFNNQTPNAPPAVSGAATDPATTMTLVNQIRTALVNYGLLV
jgi:hypothetical protein